MGSEDPSLVHVGIDLGETQFQACVAGEGVSDDEQRAFAHSGHGVAEAIEWLKRAPFDETEVEIRPLFEAEDFGAELTPEIRAYEDRQRAQLAANQKQKK